MSVMRIALRSFAILLFAGTLVWWLQSGRNPGWTKDKVAVGKKDEITGIVYTEYEDRFVPGVDILAASGAAALVLGGLSLIRSRKPR